MRQDEVLSITLTEYLGESFGPYAPQRGAAGHYCSTHEVCRTSGTRYFTEARNNDTLIGSVAAIIGNAIPLKIIEREGEVQWATEAIL